ncbi:hypothetical protein GPECTOR_6g777 [Gonium pectorale]|uniref:J domain-containing protein n=1 Tax=Gonium pectorale TaxID=33097 RepID=A0A150GVJ0_GONPE|nr:hypothetical protein GPECTOR_6g777 [Gonium pectorale]|eukprot:KXZ53859.1 hypothetical protein GPECTOR_6g777 [Gonium pectorale]
MARAAVEALGGAMEVPTPEPVSTLAPTPKPVLSSPRKATGAVPVRKLASTVAAAAATAAAAAAVRAGGWVPPPAGCRIRSGRQLAAAQTPAVGANRVSDLLCLLAEAGRAAAPYFNADVQAGGEEAGQASSEGQASTAAAPDVTEPAAMPAAAIAAAEAAKQLSRSAGQEHMRCLRAMALAALPAWEVRRVLACRVLAPAEQPSVVLRLPVGASRDEVRVAFRRLSLLVHPDKNRSVGAAEAFALVSGAASKLLGSSS